MIRVVASIAAMALLSFSAGCGSSDSGPMTKAEYTKQAKVVCHKGEQEKEEAISAALLEYQEGEKNATEQLQAMAVLKVLVPFEKTTERLAELSPPEGLEKQVETMVKVREEAAKTMRADPAKALHDSSPADNAAKLSKKLGLGTCDY